MEWYELLLVFVLWLLLAAVRSIRVESSLLSHYELKRRAKKQQVQAVKAIEREARLPQLRALQYVAETVLLVLFIVIVLSVAGFLLSLVIILVGLLLLPKVAKVGVLHRQAQDWYQRNEEKLMRWAVKWQSLLKWLESRGNERTQKVHSKEELLNIARESLILDSDELSLLQNGLVFREKTVADVMTPKSMIDYVERSETLGPVVLDRLHKTGHSRFPVIHKDIDHIVGMLYMHELVQLGHSIKTAKDAMSTDVFYIRSDQSLEHALHAFLRTHHHLFIVVNEYRETVGLLSLEDVIETLLGRKIVDEFDAFADLRAVAEANPRQNNQPKKHEDV